MNRENIQDLLYDYLQGSCTLLQSQQIEAQLQQSEEFRKALEQVKKYYKAIDTLEPVPVPRAFLDDVHERIENSGGNSLLKKLLFPLHIKLPAELIGVAGTVFLVVYFFIPQLAIKKSVGEFEKSEQLSESSTCLAAEKVQYAESEEKRLAAEDVQGEKMALLSVNKSKSALPGGTAAASGVSQDYSKKDEKVKQRTSVRKPKAQSVSEKDEMNVGRSTIGQPPAAPAPSKSSSVSGAASVSAIIGQMSELQEMAAPVVQAAPEALKAEFNYQSDKSSVGDAEDVAGGNRLYRMTLHIVSANEPELSSSYSSESKREHTRSAKLSSIQDNSGADNSTKAHERAASSIDGKDTMCAIRSLLTKYNLTWSTTDSSEVSQSYAITLPVTVSSQFFGELREIGSVSGDLPRENTIQSDTVKILLTVKK